ncbi:polysaccharide export protein [Nisaea acidiphila]|uniref:Polysaccharide export protein n=1 Tax=Nisaea acidiphila TaxID=1862145 RepID=A0A9J7AYA9_9PROT|nr:polysaccharide biosynthesis/export family protein [Nisaea acidiphila]UUX52054.1 polysaccharide export protein [Nisaea acidiphila]
MRNIMRYASNRVAVLGLLGICLALAACASPEVDELPPPATPTIAEYRLVSGDRVAVTVFGHKELSAIVDIADDGMLELPLVGKIEARGKTALGLRALVTEVVDRNYVIDPKVDIVIARYQPFYVLGEVNTPGSYDFMLGLNMRKAVAEAGGFTRRAAKTQVQLTRRTEHGQTVRDVSLDTAVFPGDVIEIKRRWF